MGYSQAAGKVIFIYQHFFEFLVLYTGVNMIFNVK